MPTPRLGNLFSRLARRRDQINALADNPFFEQGIIQQVKDNGRVIVLDGDGRARDGIRTTDEAFVVGQSVFISRTEDGRTIIHGGVR